MTGELPALEDALARDGVVRLTGPGAAHLASVWAEKVGALYEVPLAADPAGGCLWLHDAPGSRALADVLVAGRVMCGWPWALVLTGPALDGAHPDEGRTLHVQAEAPVCRAPTQVLLPEPITPDGILEAYDAGDVLRAHALLDALQVRSPEAAEGLGWIDLWRLQLTGRASEVASRRGRADAAWLIQFARAAYVTDDLERCEVMARAALDLADEPRFLEDAAWLYAVTLRSRSGEVVTVRPFTNHFRGSDAAGVYGEQLRVQVRDQRPADWLALGQLTLAARSCANEVDGVKGSSRYDRHGADILALMEVVELWRAGEVDQALDALVARNHLQRLDVASAWMWSMCWGLVNAAIGDREQVAWSIADLQRRHRLHVKPILPEVLEVRSDDLWCLVHWLEGAVALWPHVLDTARSRLDTVPTRPIVAGPYLLESVLAEGGMGKVWSAQHVPTNTPVALKVLKGLDPKAAGLFAEEIEIFARLDHPMIATVLDHITISEVSASQSGGTLHAGQLALVMERVDGGSLSDVLGCLPWEAVHDVLLALLDALAYAHANGVLHRDLKPANVLRAADGGLRLIDFGLSASTDVAGTPLYMAPEQFRRGKLDARTDIYALGCLAWALVAGVPPYLGDVDSLAEAHQSAPLPSLEAFEPMPVGLGGWLGRCLAKRPWDRFRSAADAATALEALVDAPLTALPLPVTQSRPMATHTFLLSQLMGMPEEELKPGSDEETRPTLQVLDVFEDRRAWRPRIPTTNLFRHGDPSIVGQRLAQERLWLCVLAASGGRQQRVVLEGPWGHGRRMLLRWIRRRARLAGMAPRDEGVVGRLCIVDATGTSPDDWTAHRQQPWLLVWRHAPEPATASVTPVQLTRLQPFEVMEVLQARIVLAPALVARIAVQSVGYPGLALTIASEWMVRFGTRMTEAGLVLLRDGETSAEAQGWWRERLRNTTDAERESALWVGLQTVAFPAPEVGPADRFAVRLNGALRPGPDLQAAVLDVADPTLQRELHLRLADATPQPLAAAYHRMVGTDAVEDVLACERLAFEGPVQANVRVLRQLVYHLHRHQQETRRAEAQLRALMSSPKDLAWLCTRPDPHVAVAALVETFIARRAWTAEQQASARCLSERVRSVQLFLCLARQADGECGAVLDRLRQRLPEYTALADLREAEEARLDLAAACERVRGDFSLALAFVNLADQQLNQGDYTEALRSLDETAGHWSPPAVYNRGVAELGLGRVQNAGAAAREVWPIASMDGREGLLPGLQAMLALADIDEPRWEQRFTMDRPVLDGTLLRVLRPEVERLGPSSRKQRLSAWLGR